MDTKSYSIVDAVACTGLLTWPIINGLVGIDVGKWVLVAVVTWLVLRFVLDSSSDS